MLLCCHLMLRRLPFWVLFSSGIEYISVRLELIPHRVGGHLHVSFSTSLCHQCVFFLQSEKLHVLLYHVSPSFLLSSSTAASVGLCHYNSFHAVFVLSSHHMTVCHPNLASRILSLLHATPSVFLMTSFLLLFFSDIPPAFSFLFSV